MPNSRRNKGALMRVVRLSIFQEAVMGKGILLWLIGIPIPIILLFLIFWH
jgi:hypothetical protein